MDVQLIIPPAAGSREERLAQIEAKIKQSNGGRRAWRQWKQYEADEILALARKAPRLNLLDLNITGDFHAIYELRMPVPREPVDGPLQIGDRAVFHLGYVEEWLCSSPPGWAPLGIVYPPDVFHSNLAPQLGGAICLGELPAAIRPKEILLLGFFTVSLQMLSLDETDVQGVLNGRASEFYREHPEFLPLTTAGLMDPVSMDKYLGAE
ncbi:MAG: hypothetical protein WCB27_16175 [Thermoguttaceae bacterium]